MSTEGCTVETSDSHHRRESPLRNNEELSRAMPTKNAGNNYKTAISKATTIQIVNLVQSNMERILSECGLVLNKNSTPESLRMLPPPDRSKGKAVMVQNPAKEKCQSKSKGVQIVEPEQEDGHFTCWESAYTPERDQRLEDADPVESVIKKQKTQLLKQNEHVAELIWQLKETCTTQVIQVSDERKNEESKTPSSARSWPTTSVHPTSGAQQQQMIINTLLSGDPDGPLPQNFRHVPCEYEGDSDPEEHILKFENIAQLLQHSKGVKCRVFLTTLGGPAQQWFRQLPSYSIYNFEELK